jgi:hypothetical protein
MALLLVLVDPSNASQTYTPWSFCSTLEIVRVGLLTVLPLNLEFADISSTPLSLNQLICVAVPDVITQVRATFSSMTGLYDVSGAKTTNGAVKQIHTNECSQS